MTVVLEDQVKTITEEIAEEFGGPDIRYFGSVVGIEDVVRAVIAQYDISNIARLRLPLYLDDDPDGQLHDRLARSFLP
jgi:hypothetical protein